MLIRMLIRILLRVFRVLFRGSVIVRLTWRTWLSSTSTSTCSSTCSSPTSDSSKPSKPSQSSSSKETPSSSKQSISNHCWSNECHKKRASNQTSCWFLLFHNHLDNLVIFQHLNKIYFDNWFAVWFRLFIEGMRREFLVYVLMNFVAKTVHLPLYHAVKVNGSM